MATIIQHGTAPFWGIQATITGVYLESLEFGNTATTAQLKDQTGHVVGVTVYDQEMTFNGSGSVLLGSGGTQSTRTLPTALTAALGKTVSLLTPPDGLVQCDVTPGSTATAIVNSIGWTEGNESVVSTNISGNIYYW